jgi:hypothetical protein
VNGSRLPCLAPPYTPAASATTLTDGTPVARLADGRVWVATLPGDEPAPAEAARALVSRIRARGGAVRFLSFGAHCGEELCFSYRANLCEGSVEDLAAQILATIAEDPELPRPGLRLSIQLVGELGPRCEPQDASCGPVPYDRGTRYDPDGARRLGPLAH